MSIEEWWIWVRYLKNPREYRAVIKSAANKNKIWRLLWKANFIGGIHESKGKTRVTEPGIYMQVSLLVLHFSKQMNISR
jgi:hypothetical protein